MPVGSLLRRMLSSTCLAELCRVAIGLAVRSVPTGIGLNCWLWFIRIYVFWKISLRTRPHDVPFDPLLFHTRIHPAASYERKYTQPLVLKTLFSARSVMWVKLFCRIRDERLAEVRVQVPNFGRKRIERNDRFRSCNVNVSDDTRVRPAARFTIASCCCRVGLFFV